MIYHKQDKQDILETSCTRQVIQTSLLGWSHSWFQNFIFVEATGGGVVFIYLLNRVVQISAMLEQLFSTPVGQRVHWTKTISATCIVQIKDTSVPVTAMEDIRLKNLLLVSNSIVTAKWDSTGVLFVLQLIGDGDWGEALTSIRIIVVSKQTMNLPTAPLSKPRLFGFIWF